MPRPDPDPARRRPLDRRSPLRSVALILVASLSAACGSSRHESAGGPTPKPPANAAELAAIAKARADSNRQVSTEADARFMTGMISHHAQAIVMAGWAPSHGASPSIRTLCARIINAQQDEIATMQREQLRPGVAEEPTGVVVDVLDRVVTSNDERGIESIAHLRVC